MDEHRPIDKQADRDVQSDQYRQTDRQRDGQTQNRQMDILYIHRDRQMNKYTRKADRQT